MRYVSSFDSEGRKKELLASPPPDPVSWDPGWAGTGRLGFPRARDGCLWRWVTELRIPGRAMSRWAESRPRPGRGTLSSQGSFLAIWLGGWPCRDRASFPGTSSGFRLLWIAWLQLFKLYCPAWSLLGLGFHPHCNFLVGCSQNRSPSRWASMFPSVNWE